MKKRIARLRSLTLAFTLCACEQKTQKTTQTAAASFGEPSAAVSVEVSAQSSGKVSAAAEEDATITVHGTLSLLNMTEEEYASLLEARTGCQYDRRRD